MKHLHFTTTIFLLSLSNILLSQEILRTGLNSYSHSESIYKRNEIRGFLLEQMPDSESILESYRYKKVAKGMGYLTLGTLTGSGISLIMTKNAGGVAELFTAMGLGIFSTITGMMAFSKNAKSRRMLDKGIDEFNQRGISSYNNNQKEHLRIICSPGCVKVYF